MLKKALLVVNSSGALLEFARRILERAGYIVYCAEGIAGAREHLLDHTPDGVILDSDITDGNAFDFCRELCAETGVPVLFMSGDAADELPALLAGADDYLKRTSDYGIIKARISHMLKTSGETREGISEAAETTVQSEIAGITDQNAIWVLANTPAAHSTNTAASAERYMSTASAEYNESAAATGAPGSADSLRSYSQTRHATGHATQKSLRARPWRSAAVTALCVLIAVVGLVTIYSFGHKDPGTDIFDADVPLNAAPLLPDENAVPYSGSDIDTVEYSDCLIPCYGTVSAAAADGMMQITLLNPEGNSCIFTFEIILDGSGDTLFESGQVAPGMCIEQVRSEKPLAKGDFPASVIIRAYDHDNLSERGSAAIAFTLSVS